MIASLAALQLVLLTQAQPPPKEAPPEPPAQPAAPAPGAENPPLPKKPEAKAETPAAAPARPRQLSLLGGESLGGGSASLGWAGWPSFGLMYGQGVTADDDLAGFGDFDWTKTELRLGGLYRRALGRSGGFARASLVQSAPRNMSSSLSCACAGKRVNTSATQKIEINEKQRIKTCDLRFCDLRLDLQ